MHPLHITKVAVGCASVDTLARRIAGRAAEGEAPIVTRYKPTRADELVGGSLYWIIKHRLIARQRILGFDERDGKCLIRLDATLVPVRARHKRAHQGWRYLVAADAPLDHDGQDDEIAALPPKLLSTLSALALI